jgi:protein-L-isoaspartate(D-aspartate) O-methyltransferase
MSPDDRELTERRRRMVETQLRARGIRDARVLEAMAAVPRHRFVDPREVELAYGDFPIDIGLGQTISQPYIVAYMSEALQLAPHHTVLEIGAGSGYQTAVLAGLVREVYSIEIVPEHARRAAAMLGELGFHNVHVREGDGYQGWPEHAPYNAVIVTAAPDHIPPPLVEQLAIGGRLAVPVGRWDQELLVMTKTEDGLHEESRIAVRFVPLTRHAGTS